jgi:ribonuclease HII
MSQLTDTGTHRLVAGVDEAGRGPLAGPVVVAAVILPAGRGWDGLDDSKRLSRRRRETAYAEVLERAVSWAVEVVEVEEIERVNILTATLNGMQRSVAGLDPAPSLVMVDGNRAPDMAFEVRTIIEGDRWVPSISAASVLAKVTRDRIMAEYHASWPEYGFDRHKGYPTQEHLAKLKSLGPCPIHRKTFAPVREALEPGLF